MSKRAVGAVMLFSVLAGAALLVQPAAAAPPNAPIKVSLNHWQNVGLTKNPNFPNYFTWVNGNLVQVHNTYAEQDTVPYRIAIQNARGGVTYKLTFAYETTKTQGGVTRHATDYLQTYDVSEGGGKWIPSGGSDPNPCDPLTEGPSNGPNLCTYANVDQSLVIPPDPCVTAAGVPQPAGVFSFWGVVAGSPAIVPPQNVTPAAPYTITTSGGAVLNSCSVITNATGTTYTQLTVSFVVDAPNGSERTVVMAIGGHLSSFVDWGVDLSSGSIHGSPWHFRFSLLQGNSPKPVADGNRDRSINIYKISAITLEKACTGSSTGGPFPFNITVGDDDLTKNLNCGQTYSRRLIHGDSFTFEEDIDNLPADWNLVLVACTSRRGTEFFYIGDPINGVYFTPLSHDRIICTFTNNFDTINEPPRGNRRRFMTGGGSALDSGGTIYTPGVNRVTHGFHLLCPTGNHPSPKSNNLQVNWIDASDIFNPIEYHFHLDNVTSVVCDGPGTTSPKTDWRRYTGTGTGRLNGVPGATASWRFIDNAEPGRFQDGFTITITSGSGNLTVTGPGTYIGGNINSGNHQAH